MTKLDTAFEWPKPIPGWDLMKWKDETQLQIYEEIKDLTPEEVVKYFRQAGESFHKEVERRRRAELSENKK